MTKPKLTKGKVLSMINSIQHFNEFGVRDLEKVMMNYSADMTKIAEMVYGVRDGVIKLGLNIWTAVKI